MKYLLTSNFVIFTPVISKIFLARAIMGKKINVTLYLDEELVKQAKESGLNLSRIMENTLQNHLSPTFHVGPHGASKSMTATNSLKMFSFPQKMVILDAGDGSRTRDLWIMSATRN
jgi:hypothetical protein